MFAFREAEDADEDAVYALAANFPSPDSIDRVAFHDVWKKKISESDCYVGLAEAQGAVIGYISGYMHTTFYAGKPVAWIDEIFVTEEMRNGGIGRGLMAEIVRWAADRGCRLVALASREGAEFYHAQGYEEDASRYYKLAL